MLATTPMNGTELGAHYQDLKERLHQRVIDLVDMNAIGKMAQEAVTDQLTKLIEQLLQQESVPLNQRERAPVCLLTMCMTLSATALSSLTLSSALSALKKSRRRLRLR